jgi:PHD/YefM family antitoxin component YafN of YafNO toxin-antitoxin module
MKKSSALPQPQFIVDATGKKTAVVIDIDTFEKLMEKLEDLYLGTSAEEVLENETEFYDFEKVKRDLFK